jgi:hypothetical protein
MGKLASDCSSCSSSPWERVRSPCDTEFCLDVGDASGDDDDACRGELYPARRDELLSDVSMLAIDENDVVVENRFSLSIVSTAATSP